MPYIMAFNSCRDGTVGMFIVRILSIPILLIGTDTY